MSSCDVCGKEYEYPGEAINLYRARLVERKSSGKSYGMRRVSSNYDKFWPVTVTVCKRHGKELFTQRLFPGFLVFILAMLPVAFILGKIYPFAGSTLWILYLLAAIISIGISLTAVRLISLPGLVATALTIQERRKGNIVEYITPKKYQRITHPSPGLLAIARSMLPERQSPDTHSKKKQSPKPPTRRSSR